MNSGYYVAGAQKGSTLGSTVEKMHELMVEELLKGVPAADQQVIKCGVIGEIGISWPIHGKDIQMQYFAIQYTKCSKNCCIFIEMFAKV